MKNKYLNLIMIGVLALSLFATVGCNNDNPVPGQEPQGKVLASTEGFSANLWYNDPVLGTTIKITLGEGITFKNIESEKDVTDWFSNLPNGVRVKAPKALIVNNQKSINEGVKGEEPKEKEGAIVVATYGVNNGDKSATFTLEGQVNETPDEPIQISIPPEYTSYGQVINVVFTDTTTSTVKDTRLKVTFVLNDGTDRKIIDRVYFNSKVEEPEDPEREGYRFVQWLGEDGEYFDWNTSITRDTTITALWESLTTAPPVITIVGEADGVFDVKIDRNNGFGMIYYSTDGSDLTTDVKQTKNHHGNEIVVRVTKGSLIKAFVLKYGNVSEETSLQTENVTGFFAYGTETKDVRVLKKNSQIDKPERNERAALFIPATVIREDVASNIYKPNDDSLDNGVYIERIFEYSNDKLLVVGRYSNTFSRMNYFYYFVDKSTGNESSTAEIIFDCVEKKLQFVAKGVELMDDGTLYLLGTISYRPCVFIYDLNNGNSEFKYLSEDLNGARMDDTFATEDAVYGIGDKNENPAIWRIDHLTKATEERVYPDYAGAAQKGAGTGSSLYLIFSPVATLGDIVSVNKQLVHYNYAEKKIESTIALQHAYDGATTIGDVAIVDGELLIAGGNADSWIYNSFNQYPYRPCIWDKDGNQTILVETNYFGSGCAAVTPHTIQVSNGKVYLLCNSTYDAFGGNGQAIYKFPIHLGSVIEIGKPNSLLEFGSGWYHRALDTHIYYFSPGN